MNGIDKKQKSDLNSRSAVNHNRTLAILTSGGDAPGMNPAIRAIVGCWLEQDIDNRIIAFKGGYSGVCRNKYITPDRDYVAGLSARGGTIITAGRCEGLKIPGSSERNAVRQVLTAIDDLAGVVVIGGNGSFRGMVDVIEKECGIQAIGIPATIDNDIWRTDLSLGVDTALNTAVEIIDKIRDTAAAFRRAFVVEIMGRECGYLALATALATEAEAVFLPEDEPGFDDLGDIQRKLDELYRMDALNSVIIAAEGSKIKRSTIQNIVGTYTNWEVRSVVPGYAERGGRPSAIDRILGCRFAAKALEGINNKQLPPKSKVTTLEGTNIILNEELDDICENSGKKARVGDMRFKKLIRLQKHLTPYHDPLPYADNVGCALLTIHGADAPGINAAIRAFTRIAIAADKNIDTQRIRTVAVRQGLKTLADYNDELDLYNFIPLEWQMTDGFTYAGGVPVSLSQQYNIEPIRACPKNWLETQTTADAVNNMNMKIDQFERTMLNKGTPSPVRCVVVIGGRDAINCIKEIRNNHFNYPIIYIPASIDNDVYQSDYSIGFDTALNCAVKAIDKVRETALAEGRVFLIETMGGKSGFLPLSIGLAAGAEHIFIPEIFRKPGPTLNDIDKTLNAIIERFKTKKKHSILVFHESIIKHLGGIDNITKRLAGVGAVNVPPFEVRPTIFGYAQRGGTPSAFDRILATCLGAEAARGLRGIRGQFHDGFAVVLKNNSIEKISLERIINLSQQDVQEYEQRMKELAETHCKLEKSDTLMAAKWNDIEILQAGSACNGRMKTVELWENFWNSRP
jgi:6-phosphofructokinase 1